MKVQVEHGGAAGATTTPRFFGVETEYGYAKLGLDGERLDPSDSVRALVGAIKNQGPFLSGSTSWDLFTVNGSRVYIDTGLHPEVATPECSTPEEAVCFTRAGDRLLARAVAAIAGSGEQGESFVWKGNVDHRSRETWGSHESYLHHAPQSVLAEQLITHLVTRIVYTGAGGFDSLSRRLRFVVSPRAMHLRRVRSSSSTGERGIFHTRDEPLASPPNRRLHLLAGESLWSETADYLRIGVTALLVAQVDAGRTPQRGLELASPLEALATISHDPACTATVRLATGERLTALAIQRRLLEGIEADLEASHLPPWARAVCGRWRAVLDRLEAGPTSLVGVLDWPTKLAILKRQCESHGVPWTFANPPSEGGETSSRTARRADPAPGVDHELESRLLETDLRFNQLDEHGIFFSLDERAMLAHQVVPSGRIERALREPPATGRARVRSACIQRLAGRGEEVWCAWDQVVDEVNRKRLILQDPLQSEEGEWQPTIRSRPARRPESPELERFCTDSTRREGTTPGQGT